MSGVQNEIVVVREVVVTERGKQKGGGGGGEGRKTDTQKGDLLGIGERRSFGGCGSGRMRAEGELQELMPLILSPAIVHRCQGGQHAGYGF